MKNQDRSFLEYLEDMVEAIGKIQKYLATVTEMAEFLNNDMLIDAVTRNFEIIGEAANKIPADIKVKYPEVPWRQMYGLRNFAAHDYHRIDYTILWYIARDYLPENKLMLQRIIANENKPT